MIKGDKYYFAASKEIKKEKPNKKLVLNLLNKAADLNNSKAQYAIGTWYLHGECVKKNAVTAVKYFLEAIKGNNKNAFYDLAVCCEKGVGIKKNYKGAFKYYLNAALLGDKQSLYEVGRCYYYGIGISKNKAVASIWLEHAKLNGIVD